MPVEIRELIIRVVTAPATDAADQSQQRPSGNAKDTQAIIQECVRQVLRILQQQKER